LRPLLKKQYVHKGQAGFQNLFIAAVFALRLPITDLARVNLCE